LNTALCPATMPAALHEGIACPQTRLLLELHTTRMWLVARAGGHNEAASLVREHLADGLKGCDAGAAEVRLCIGLAGRGKCPFVWFGVSDSGWFLGGSCVAMGLFQMPIGSSSSARWVPAEGVECQTGDVEESLLRSDRGC
jgi:hypothetical protein